MWVDIAIIGIILLFAVVGLLKGFMKTLLSFAGVVLALIAAVLLTKPVVASLAGSKIETMIGDKVFTLLSGMGDLMTTEIPSYEVLVEVLQQSLPASVAQSLAQSVAEMIGTSANQTLAQLLTPGLTNIFMNLLVFIALFVILMIIFAIVKAIVNAVKHIKLIDIADKILGFILGALMGVAFVYLIMLILTLLTGVESINNLVDMILASSLGSIMYNNNLIAILFNQLLDTGTINPEELIQALPTT